MKIGSPPDTPPVAPVTTGRTDSGDASRKTTAATAPQSAEPSAQVEISSTATSLMSGTQGTSAEFDAKKVARMSQAIADGSFTVNPEAIADKLIANAQELLTKAAH